MSICSSYEKISDGLGGFVSRCNGTKEQEGCSCGGDETKCDFYATKREKQTNIQMSALEYLQQKIRMCDYESDRPRLCSSCPIFTEFIAHDKTESCDDIDTKFPEKVIELVYNWAQTHPEMPTWNEWLHSIYKYYETPDSHNFIEWLNTPVAEKEAIRYRIPPKKDL